VDQAEDLGARRALLERADNVAVVDDVGGELARLDVEDEDEDRDAAEDVRARVCEVVLDEAVLAERCQCRTDDERERTLRSPRG
jgi:hypothetical protein